MTITESAIQLMASERLTDFDDGGGRMTGTVVVDGASNNLFDDISELDRTYGRVSLRKCYAAVRTALSDTYYGSHLILASAPSDPRVSMTMFNSKSWSDERSDARDFLERYLARGGRWHGYLYERQLAGQRVIQIWQRVELELPTVGSVLTLVADRDKPTEVEQYVRILKTTDHVRTFTHQSAGDFKRRVITCELSDPLRHDFVGAAITPYDAEADKAAAQVLRTVVADAAKYYGVTKLAQPAKLGALRIRVNDIFSQLVPSARAETAIVDANASGENATLVATGGEYAFSSAAELSPSVSLYLGTACMPGSLTITGSGYTLTDVGGELRNGSTPVGSVDAARGIVQVASGGPSFAGTKTVKFRPAGAPNRLMDTAAIKVTIENRGFTYPATLPVSPTPGSVLVSYMAQGKWYDLRDNGAGVLKGADSSFGAGTVNYATGTVLVTCGALPDVGSSIMFGWATAVNYFDRSAQTIKPPALKAQLFSPEEVGTVAANFASIRISWTDGAAQKSAAVDSRGVISGDATGNVYQDGTAVIVPNAAPLGGTQFRVAWSQFVNESVTVTTPSSILNDVATINLGYALKPGSVRIDVKYRAPASTWSAEVPGRWKEKKYEPEGEFYDLFIADDNGVLRDQAGAQIGTVDYATGRLTISTKLNVQIPYSRYQWLLSGVGNLGGSYAWICTGIEYRTALCVFDATSSPYQISYSRTANLTPVEKTYTLDKLTVDLTEGFAERIVAGSLSFEYAGKRYIDVGGRLTTDFNPATGAGVTAGQINYQTGETTINNWMPGANNAVVLRSLLTELGGQTASNAVFRVPVAPLRPGSLSLSVTAIDGTVTRVDSDADQYFGNEYMEGEIDYTTGVVSVRFGKWVLASSLVPGSFEPDSVVDGKVWQSKTVAADTIRYNAVGYTYLPMDSTVLGLDAVRLPSDGRVPIFGNDNVVVVHHTGRFALPNPVSAGVPYSVGRARLAAVEIVDVQGRRLPKDRYTADLDAGTVTLKSPLDLTGTSGTLTVEHRVEDMARCYDVQINGEIALTRQLSHDYPANDTLVSSAMILGDLRARYSKLFSQQSWTNKWQDVIDGSAILAKYNDSQYPIGCVNEGTIEERWALIFTSTSDFRIVGETLGQIGTGSINADLAPVNPVTGTPYFSIKAVGWGAGWSAGNVLRFNTHASNAPLWLARTVLMGPATSNDDRFVIQIRGDTDS